MFTQNMFNLFSTWVLVWAALAGPGQALGDALKPGTRYVLQGDTIYDRKTDLTWQRCTYGQHWREVGECQGEPRRLTFDDANKLKLGGWRLPTLDELNSIVVRGRKPSIDATLFPNTPPLYYWATDNRDNSFAWYVFFENGVANHYFPPRTNKDLARLVRSGKWPPGKP